MKIALSILIVLALTGCADGVSLHYAAGMEKVGFLHGLWHGFIIFFSFFGSLFFDDIAIYAVYNSGGWYDFGYFMGVGALGGAGASR